MFVKGVFSVICRCLSFMTPLVDNRFSGPSPVVVVVGHGRGRFHQVPRRPWSSPAVVGRGRGRRQSISPGGPSPVDFLGDRRWALSSDWVGLIDNGTSKGSRFVF